MNSLHVHFRELLFAMTIAMLSMGCHAQDVMSIKGVIKQTITQGKATAWVEGGVADKYIAQFQNIVKRPPGPTSKMVIVVGERLQTFDAECARVQLKISRPGWTLATTDGKQVPAELGMAMNVCVDGSPAPQGIDIQRMAPAAAPLRPTRPPLEMK